MPTGSCNVSHSIFVNYFPKVGGTRSARPTRHVRITHQVGNSGLGALRGALHERATPDARSASRLDISEKLTRPEGPWNLAQASYVF